MAVFLFGYENNTNLLGFFKYINKKVTLQKKLILF